MFIYSLRASTLKFFGVIALSLLTLAALVFFIPAYDGGAIESSAVLADGQTVEFTGIKTEEDRLNFISSLGWEVKAQPIEEEKVTIPAEFDRVLSEYNILQQQQGLDLAKFKRKKATRYTYEVTNYTGWDGPVYLNLLVCRNRIIGGDICSADANGFVTGLIGQA